MHGVNAEIRCLQCSEARPWRDDGRLDLRALWGSPVQPTLVFRPCSLRRGEVGPSAVFGGEQRERSEVPA